jgi:hypothetical protein
MECLFTTVLQNSCALCYLTPLNAEKLVAVAERYSSMGCRSDIEFVGSNPLDARMSTTDPTWLDPVSNAAPHGVETATTSIVRDSVAIVG